MSKTFWRTPGSQKKRTGDRLKKNDEGYIWDVPFMSKVTFPVTIIGLKLQLFLRCCLPASGIRNKRNAQGYNHLMHSESFHCPKVTWLVCCNTPWQYWLNEQKSRAVCREQEDRVYRNASSTFYILILLWWFWCWACFEKAALYLQHYASEQIVTVSNGRSAALVWGTFASSSAARGGVGMSSLEAVPGGKRESERTIPFLKHSWHKVSRPSSRPTTFFVIPG